MKMNETYRVNGSKVTITKVPWGFIIRKDGQDVASYSTRKAALNRALKEIE